MKTAIILLLGLAGAGAPASLPRWNPKAPENSQILPAFDSVSVGSVLNGIGAQYQRGPSGPAGTTILVTFANGRKAVLTLGACEPSGTGCKAMSLQSTWTRIANAPAQRTAAAIERFNQHYSFAKAFVTPDGRPSLQRYLTADYGFIRGNLAVNLLTFASQAEQFATTILKPLESR